MQKKILPKNNIKIGLATPRFTGSLDLSSIVLSSVYFGIHVEWTHFQTCCNLSTSIKSRAA